MEQDQRPQALLLWRVTNYLRGERDQPTPLETIRQWLGYLPQAPAPVPPPAPLEAIKRNLGAVHTLFQALYGQNGQHDPVP